MHIPGAVEIAHIFEEDHSSKFARIQPAEGFDLEREGGEYCYYWMHAYVDHDYEQYFLLDIRTKTSEQPDETRDFLYVRIRGGSSADGSRRAKVECEWYGKPIVFGAGAEAHLKRDYQGMVWFAGKIDDDIGETIWPSKLKD